MKLSVAFLTLALGLGATVEAGVTHRHHARHGHEHAKRDMELVTVRVTKTVYVDQHGSPWTTQAPPSLPTETEDVVITTTVVTTSSSKSKPQHTTSVVIEESPVSNGDPEGEFPDGEVDCSEFPSKHGAIPVPWIKLGGWTGIQVDGGAGSKCTENCLCSYACPPGYSKAQWPVDQPASGESHGGLLCKGGKLYKTSGTNKGLCVKGHGSVYVKNQLSENVPICRTDYPGSENMNVPLDSQPGTTIELTSPDGDTYYHWRGKMTSAQYYVNPAGTSLEDGCIWGVPNGGLGNWSPMIFGAGYSAGMTWLSISQNQLNSNPLNFNVKIVGGPGAKLNGDCKYEGGVFSGGGPGEQGCTAALVSGEAYFVLY